MRSVLNGIARLWSKGCLGKGAVVFGALVILGMCSAILGGGNRNAQTTQTPAQQAPTAAPQLAASGATEPPAPTDAPRPTATPKPTQTLVPTFTPEPTITVKPHNVNGVPPLNKDNCPPDYPVKGNIGSNGKIYHVKGASSYGGTDPEICFATAADAEAAGFRRPAN